MWPVKYSRWNVFIVTCDVLCCDGYDFAPHITGKLLQNQVPNIENVGIYIAEHHGASWSILRNFPASHELQNTPSQACSIASFGWAVNAAMLYTHDGIFQSPCDTSKSHAMYCDAFSNTLEFLFPILDYLGYLLSDFQTVCTIVIVVIPYAFM